MADVEPTDDTRARYAMIRAAGLLEGIEAAFQGRGRNTVWRAEPRLGRTETDSGYQFRNLIGSAARSLPTRVYEDYITSLTRVHGMFTVTTNGSELIATPTVHGFTGTGSWEENRVAATHFILFAMNLYSEILALPEAATKFPIVQATRAYRTWASDGKKGGSSGA